MTQRKSQRKYLRVFFSTDLHASEIVFRKFISTAKFYQADALVMGGDVTGKTIVPLVKDADGRYHFNFQGQEFQHISEKELSEFETRIANAGLYPYRTSETEYESIRSDPVKISAISDGLMTERLTRWASLAEENLAPLDVKCYWTGGNDDHQKILDSVKSSQHFVNVEEMVIQLDDEHEMASLGWSNATPWNTPRETSEETLAEKIDRLMRGVKEPSSCILNVHPPPYDCGLDIAPKLDTGFDPPRPIVSGGQQVLIPVGSTAIRKSIEEAQPLLVLCGHIHETKNESRIGKTMCINPGSEYASGILRGVILNLLKTKVLSYQFTSG